MKHNGSVKKMLDWTSLYLVIGVLDVTLILMFIVIVITSISFIIIIVIIVTSLC